MSRSGASRRSDELAGAADTAVTIGKNAVMQPIAGLSGVGRGTASMIARMLRGEGVRDASRGAIDDAVTTIDDVQGLAGGPETAEGGRNLEAMGDAMDWAAEKLGNPVDRAGSASPLAGALLAGAGAVIDPTKVGRGVKTASKAVKKAAASRQIAKTIDEAAAGRSAAFVEPTDAAQRARLGLLPQELAGFGDKALREAAAEKKVARADERVVEKQKGGGARGGAADAREYRKIYETQGYPEVLARALRETHLKPNPDGGWIGIPRTVQNRSDLRGMRGSLDQQLAQGVSAIQYADPEHGVGTWYPRAQNAHRLINEPHQFDRGLEGAATYSAGVSPDSELAFNLKHQNSRALGTSEMAYRGAPMRSLDEAVANDQKVKHAAKVGEYRNKNDYRVPLDSPYGVNDFRMAQSYGYTDPAGDPWKAGVSETMHPVMDQETLLMGKRASDRRLGGIDKWTGSITQEIPWVLGKAEDLYSRGYKGRFKGDEPGMPGIVQGIVQALREANSTVADSLPKHTLSATYEAAPSVSSGHMAQVPDMPFEQRRAYGETGDWATPAPMAAMDFESPYGTIKAGEVGAGNRDSIYRAVGMRQLPTTEGEGSSTNAEGVHRSGPMKTARPLMDFATADEKKGIGTNTINPDTKAAVTAAEGFRALVDAQDAGAANLAVTMAGRKGKQGLLMERAQAPTGEELANVQSLLEGTDAYAVPNNRGMHIMQTSDDPGNREAVVKLLRKMQSQIDDAFPGATRMAADNEGVYVPGLAKYDPELDKMVPTVPGSGEATAAQMQRFADAPPEVARGMSESEEIRSLIKQKIDRDRSMGGDRPDIQKTRQFFAEADWQKAVDLVRKGAKPAAAIAALGYSLQGMAAQEAAAALESAAQR